MPRNKTVREGRCDAEGALRRRLLQRGAVWTGAFVLTSILFGGTAAGQATAKAARDAGPPRPNVLFLIIEDCSARRFGCYGNPVCKTPSLDRLAQTGLRFDAAHTTPPCCPSRTALLTGCRPSTTGVYENSDEGKAKQFEATHPFLPDLFRQAGYETIRIGKVGHTDNKSAWSEITNANGDKALPRRKAWPQATQGPASKPGAKVIGGAFFYGPTGLDDADEPDGRAAELAIQRIAAKRDKPFFLAVGFHSTHLAFRAPDKYFAMYPPEKIEIPKNPGSEPDGMPTRRTWNEIKKTNAFSAMGSNNPSTLREWKEAIAAQYACVTFIDAQIGKILDAVEKSGQAGRTIVVVWSDHGFMLGEHYQWRKGQMYNESTQSALLLRAPGVTRAGSVHKGPVECMDLFATLLDLCGLPIPPGTECASMRPAIENPDKPWRKAALIEGGAQERSLVTSRWRYTEQTIKGQTSVALYDQQSDPGEFVNLADKPEHAQTVASLSAMLRGGWKGCLLAE